MKKIKDERLILRNLEHIKITYIIQTIGILSILGYDFLQGGLEGMRQNPLWYVFILTSVVYAYLSMSVNVENEKEVKQPQKSFYVSIVVLSIIVLTVGCLTSLAPDSTPIDGLIIGAILFICGFIPIYYIYRLREKHNQDLED
jgi:predicted neutral ceramidase superfamily lipid hydrolase